MRRGLDVGFQPHDVKPVAAMANHITYRIVSPLSLLKNPMILMAIVGFGFVVGMPYLLDNSTSLSKLSCSVPFSIFLLRN